MTLQIGVLGSSQTGKTVWLCALWWQLAHAKAAPGLRLRCKDAATRGYIKRGVEHLAELRQFPGHTNAPTDLALALSRPSGRELDLSLRDYRGEDFDRAFGEEQLAGPARALREWVEGCGALLVFVAPFDVQWRAGSVSVRTLTVLEGLERALGARSSSRKTKARPHVAFVLTMTDLVPQVRSTEEVEGFLRACGLGTAIDSLATVAASVAFFGVSSLGRVEQVANDVRPPADWKPVGVESPLVWAEERLRRDRFRRRATVAGVGLASLLGSACLIAGVERSERESVLAPCAQDALSLIEGAQRAEAYLARWHVLASPEAEGCARSRRHEGDRLLFTQVAACVSESVAQPTNEPRARRAIAALEEYLQLAGERGDEARALADSVRLARLEQPTSDTQAALAKCREEARHLLTVAGRASFAKLVSELEARLEREDRERCEEAVAHSLRESHLPDAIATIDQYLAKHGRVPLSGGLHARRTSLLGQLEDEIYGRTFASLRGADDDGRCVVLRAYLAAHGSGPHAAEARSLLEEAEARADDAAFARASQIGSRDAAGLERLSDALRLYVARPGGRHHEEADRLLWQASNMRYVLESLARKVPDPDLALRSIRRALDAGGGPFKGELERLARLWSSVDVRVRPLAAHVRRSHSEWFSDPDPRVIVSVGGNEVFRTREYTDTYDAQLDEPARTFAYVPGQAIEIVLEDVDVFGSKEIDRVLFRSLLHMDGTVALGDSRVQFELLGVEPRGAR